MPTIELPREQWAKSLDDISRKDAGRLCKMEVLGLNMGAQIEAHDLPFAGISVDERDGVPMRIALGDFLGTHVSHAIAAPERLRIKQSPSGVDETLEIRGDGLQTLITFGPAIRNNVA